jgi:hypothetical protein
VQIIDNNYVDNSLVIPIHQFIQYLLRHDKLYFETNDISTGTLVTKTYHLTFDNYWDEMEREYKEQDIYDFIIATCVDFTKAIDKLILRLDHTLTQYIW